MNRLICIVFFFFVASSLKAQEPSKFHAFVGKTGISVEARLLSISEDRSTLTMEGRDGNVFESKVTGLSLDDQQFVRRWMEGKESEPAPGAPVKGKLRVFGLLANDQPIDDGAAAEFDDFVAVAAMKHGWLGLRENGETLSFSGRNSGLTDVKWLGANTVWFNYVKRDGTVWEGNNRQAFADVLRDVEQSVCGSGHHAVRYQDGTVGVWGRPYDSPKSPEPPPEPLENIVDIASCQGAIAAVDAEGRIYCWDMKTKEVKSAMIGDGVVNVEGSIFDFVVLTRSGEVFEWAGSNPDRAHPPRLKEEMEGKAVAVRSGGSTRAAQMEDGTWLAWGKNSAGIIDKINSLGPVADLAVFSEPRGVEDRVGRLDRAVIRSFPVLANLSPDCEGVLFEVVSGPSRALRPCPYPIP